MRPGAGGGGNQQLMFNGDGVLILQDERVLLSTGVWIHLILLNCS